MLLLGPRQTGKTTLMEAFRPDLLLNFLRPEVRQRYERAPQRLGAEVEALAERVRGRKPLVGLKDYCPACATPAARKATPASATAPDASR